MEQLFGILTAAAITIGFVPYVRDIVRGKTKPQRATWLIWTILCVIVFASQLADGAKWSLVLPAWDAVMVFIIFLLSLRNGVGGSEKQDIIGLGVAGLGLLLWLVTDIPVLAVLAVIVVDGVATGLTVAKTYKRPDTETLFTWVMFSLSGLCAALAVGSWEVHLLLWPLFIMLADGSVALTILLGRRRKETRA